MKIIISIPYRLNLYNFCLNNIVGYIDRIGLPHSTQSSAARAGIQKWNAASIREDTEYCGMICRKQGASEFICTSVTGAEASCEPSDAPCPNCYLKIAYWHTHGAFIDKDGNGKDDRYFTEELSKNDVYYAEDNDIDGYLGTPLGSFFMYDHNGKKTVTKTNWN